MITEFIRDYAPDPHEAAVREAIRQYEEVAGIGYGHRIPSSTGPMGDVYQLRDNAYYQNLGDFLRSLLPASGDGVERRDIGEIDTTFDIWAVRGKMINQFRWQGESWKWMSSYDCNVSTGELPDHGRVFQCAPEHTPALLCFLAGLIDGEGEPETETKESHIIRLTKAEVQSKMDRISWAQGLIRQLPEDHDGRNSWLLNFGRCVRSYEMREDRGIKWDAVHQCAERIDGSVGADPDNCTEKPAPFFGPVPAEDQPDPNAKLLELRETLSAWDKPSQMCLEWLDGVKDAISEIDKLLAE